MVPMLAFDPEVYASRLTLVQAHLDSQGLGGVLLFDPENMYWLTGYQTIGYFTFQTMFVPASGKPVVVSRVVNRDLALAHDTIDEFIDIVDTASPVDVLAVYLNDTVPDTRPIGIETRAFYLTVKDHRALDTATAHELQDWGGVIEPARMCKLDAEIECMRHAARAAEAGLRAAIDTVAPGKTENDGSEYLGHPPLGVAGERTALCFAMWRRQAIARDDVVVLEAAGCVERYHAMLSRPVVAGTPSTRQQDAADALQGVLEAAIDAIKPGLSAAEVDDRCRQVVEKRGLGKFFKHRSAYGIGIGFPPNWSEGHIYAIRPDDPLVLQPNMTFHVIPTVFLENFGMCFSDSVRVTQTGCELLTKFPRRLYSID